MSWQAVADVLAHSSSYGADRLVELAIAERADELGRDSKGSMADVARRANLCRFREAEKGTEDYDRQYDAATRAARRSVRSLERLGRLEAGESTTRGVVSYRIAMRSTPDTVSGVEELSEEPTPDTTSGTPDHMSGAPRTPRPGTPDTVSPKPSFNPKAVPPIDQAAAAAASSEDGELDELVSRIFVFWQKETDQPDSKLTAARREAIERGFEHYDGDELAQAIRNWRFSPFHSGRNQTGKVFNDLTWLLKDDNVIEELRALKLPGQLPQRGRSTNPGMDQAARFAAEAERLAGDGLRDPALTTIVARGRAEDEEERQRKAAKYDALVEEAYVAPSLTPAQVRAEHGELTDRVGELEAQKMTSTTRSELAEAREELARLQRDWAGLFGTGELAA